MTGIRPITPVQQRQLFHSRADFFNTIRPWRSLQAASPSLAQMEDLAQQVPAGLRAATG